MKPTQCSSSLVLPFILQSVLLLLTLSSQPSFLDNPINETQILITVSQRPFTGLLGAPPLNKSTILEVSKDRIRVHCYGVPQHRAAAFKQQMQMLLTCSGSPALLLSMPSTS